MKNKNEAKFFEVGTGERRYNKRVRIRCEDMHDI